MRKKVRKLKYLSELAAERAEAWQMWSGYSRTSGILVFAEYLESRQVVSLITSYMAWTSGIRAE